MKKQRQETTEDKPSSRETNESKRQRLSWRRIAVFGLLGVALFIGSWLACDLTFTTFTIGGKQLASRHNDSTLRRSVADATVRYQLNLSYPDKTTKSYTWPDMGLSVDTAATIHEMRHAQYTWSHILHWWRPIAAPVQISVNKPKLTAFVKNNASIIVAPAQNAELTIVNGTAQIVSAVPGKQYSLANAEAAVRLAASSLNAQPLSLRLVQLPPARNDASLSSAKAQLTTILNQHIDIAIGNQTVNPSSTDIGNWIIITPTDTGATFTVDQGKVNDYLSQIASDHNTSPRSQIILDSNDQVIQSGAQGMNVNVSQEVIDSLTGSVAAGKGSKVTLPVSYTAFQTVHSPATGKWLEVNLSTKRMYAYDQGELVQTFLVSAGAAGTPTVTGRFAIYAKYPSQTMTGPNLDGSYYVQPDVPWVNYFYGSYAIHGNYWRPASYFGNINSSHGCVGVPVSDGAWIYSWAPIGTPVIVHY